MRYIPLFLLSLVVLGCEGPREVLFESCFQTLQGLHCVPTDVLPGDQDIDDDGRIDTFVCADGLPLSPGGRFDDDGDGVPDEVDCDKIVAGICDGLNLSELRDDHPCHRLGPVTDCEQLEGLAEDHDCNAPSAPVEPDPETDPGDNGR